MTRALHWCLCVAVALLAFPAKARAEANDASRSVDALVHKYVHDDGPGMAVLVVKDGKVVHRKGYGLADLAKKTKIGPETNFELASLSKPITALAIMLLCDQGKLAFDDDVGKHLRGLPAFDPKRKILIRDLLTHMSGLRRDYPDIASTNKAVLAWLQTAKKPVTHPIGAEHHYSNVGYALLALIVERASGKSFNDFLHDEMFSRLKMTRTVAFESPKVSRKQHAVGYELKDKVKEFKEKDSAESVLKRTKASNFAAQKANSYVVGDGGIWSNLDDLVLWDEAVRNKKLARAETWKEALTMPRLASGKKVDYGFGWGLTTEKGQVTEVWHEGAYGGFSTLNSVDFEARMCLVILSNIGGFEHLSKIEDGIRSIYLGKMKR